MKSTPQDEKHSSKGFVKGHDFSHANKVNQTNRALAPEGKIALNRPTTKKPEEMLRFDLHNETETIKNYRQRIKQAEALGHYTLAEQIRSIIVQQQNHQYDLATALGIEVPKVLETGA